MPSNLQEREKKCISENNKLLTALDNNKGIKNSEEYLKNKK